MHPTKIYGHRGAMGEYPENTLLSFEKAILQGVDGLELDVQLTKDGEVVVIHDERLERTTTGEGYIKDLPLDEIKGFSAGKRFADLPKYEADWDKEKVPTLEEVFALLQDYPEIELNIELKTTHVRYEGLEEKVLELCKLYGGKRNIIFSSFHLPSILKMKSLDEQAKIAWLIHRPVSHLEEYMEIFHLEAVHLSKDIMLTNPYPFMEKRESIRVWTANGKDEIKQLLDLQVDTIMTDFPERALFYRSERAEHMKVFS